VPSEQPDRVRRPRTSSKGEILRRFAARVAERGYEQTAIGDIAAELGLSKGTIVHHYGSKLALLEKVHGDFMRRRLMEGRAVVERLSNPAEQLGAMIYCLLLVYREDRTAALTFTREITHYAADAELADVRALRDEYFDLVHGIVRRGMASGLFRAEDPRIVTLQIFGMCNWSWTWIEPEGERSIEEIAAIYTRTLLAGLASRRTVARVLDDPDGKVPTLVRELMRESLAAYR
jgi:TetR/AcrR family transcriptional regulator, cholesterol catabolism regulator